MGIGPQNLGAAGMNPKSKPCGTPLKMSKDSSAFMFNDKLRKAADEGKLDNNPEFKKAVEGDDAPLKLTVKGMDFSEDSAGADKYKTANINEGEIETASVDELGIDKETGDALKGLFTKKEKYSEGDVIPSSTRGSARDFIKRKRKLGKIGS